MKILVSNDDGYRAEGIGRLRAALAALPGVTVTVVAPDRNRSGASNSLTLDVPLRVTQIEPGVHYVAGTPTDCVHLAISGFFDYEFDMVVSGVNDGANLGDDVLYSGTVAAAIEGRFLGLPALAISLCTVARRARPLRHRRRALPRALVRQLLRAAARSRPDPERQRAGPAVRAAQGLSHHAPGFRHRSEPLIAAREIRAGEPVYWVGPAGRRRGCGRGHRLPCGRRRVRLGDAAADRSDAACRAAGSCRAGWSDIA